MLIYIYIERERERGWERCLPPQPTKGPGGVLYKLPSRVNVADWPEPGRKRFRYILSLKEPDMMATDCFEHGL